MEFSPLPRLPKTVEADERLPQLIRYLTAKMRRLWREGKTLIPVVAMTAELEASLRHEQVCGHLVRGLESAQILLEAERRGLQMADGKAGVREARVSRLILLADDGAERFYRNVETLLARHEPRVLAVLLEIDAAGLGGSLFGSGRIARLLLLKHKQSVGRVLQAIAGGVPAGEAKPNGR